MKILNVILTSTLLFFLAPIISIAQEAKVTLEFPNQAKIIGVVQNYINAVQAGDIAKMDAQLASNFKVFGLGGGLESLDRAQHKEYFSNRMSQYKYTIGNPIYLPVKVTNSDIEGEWVNLWVTNTITNKKTGKSIDIPMHSNCRVVNGKIVVMNYFYDMLNFLKSQGYIITPPKD